MVSVMFKYGHRKTLTEAADDVSSVVDLFADFSVPASDVVIVQYEIVEDEIVEKYFPWNLRELTFMGNWGPAGLQWIRELCRSCGFSVSSDVQSV